MSDLSTNTPAAQLIDELELRAMLTASLLEHLHPVAHRFVTHELLESLLDTIFIYLDSLDLDKLER